MKELLKTLLTNVGGKLKTDFLYDCILVVIPVLLGHFLG